MLWRDKALIKCSTALSTGVFIKEWHLKSVTCNDERNVRFCTKNYIFIKAHFRNTPSTCSTKFNLCSELCLYRIQKEEKKKLLTRIISINLHIFSTELYTFSSNGLPHLNLDVQVFCVYGIRFQSLKKLMFTIITVVCRNERTKCRLKFPSTISSDWFFFSKLWSNFGQLSKCWKRSTVMFTLIIGNL